MAKITKVKLIESGWGYGFEDAINEFIEELGDKGEVVNISTSGDNAAIKAIVMYHEN